MNLDTCATCKLRKRGCPGRIGTSRSNPFEGPIKIRKRGYPAQNPQLYYQAIWQYPQVSRVGPHGKSLLNHPSHKKGITIVLPPNSLKAFQRKTDIRNIQNNRKSFSGKHHGCTGLENCDYHSVALHLYRKQHGHNLTLTAPF